MDLFLSTKLQEDVFWLNGMAQAFKPSAVGVEAGGSLELEVTPS